MSKRSPTVIVTSEPAPMPSTEPVAPAASEPTATQLLAADAAAADAADLAAALVHLAPLRPAAEANLPARLALREGAAPALKRAMSEDLGVLTAFKVPEHLLRALEATRIRVAEDARAVDHGARGLRDLGTLTAAECRRTAWHHTAGRWPFKVERIEADLRAIGAPLEQPRRNLADLLAVLARLDGWVTGERARGGCLPPRMAQESIPDSPLRTELAFNPLKVP